MRNLMLHSQVIILIIFNYQKNSGVGTIIGTANSSGNVSGSIRRRGLGFES